MKINQVEELVGITKKNIRFYEDQGLLNPGRNPENGYREYHTEDVNLLFKIKLLRKLGVPIEEIRLLLEEKCTMAECMEKHLIHLNHEQHDLELMKQMCTSLAENPVPITQLNASDYLEEMEKLEKGGSQFVNIEKSDILKKKRGPAIAAGVVILFLLCMVALMIWAYTMEPMPLWTLLIMLVSLLLPIAGISIALLQRFKEIEGGEEDEARKY